MAFTDTWTDTVALLKSYGPTYGPALLIVAWTFWRDYRRENRLTLRIDALEVEFRKVLLPVVEKATATIARNTVVYKLLKRRMRRDEIRAAALSRAVPELRTAAEC